MGPGMFDGLEQLFKMLLGLVVVFVPLGLWKLIELVWWVFVHLHWAS